MGSLKIGPWELGSPFYLAPMAGQTNRAFRELCRELGGVGLVCTELISSQALEYSRARALSGFDFSALEAPLAVQLFGADPRVMAEAARVVADRGASMVDINMGCWVPKVVKKGGGAALLGDVCQAARVVEAVRAAVTIPVTVKVRSGLDARHLTAVPFARLAAELGVEAIAVHARTAEQGFSGAPDWSVIRAVREAVSIPVFGNGDLESWDDCVRMRAETGCDGWMVGRAALGAPWIFRSWRGCLDPPPLSSRGDCVSPLDPPPSSSRGDCVSPLDPPPSSSRGDCVSPLDPPPWDFRRAVALRHLQLTREWSPLLEEQAVRELRGQLSRYQLGLEMRDRLVRLRTYAEGEALLGGMDWRDHPWAGLEGAALPRL